MGRDYGRGRGRGSVMSHFRAVVAHPTTGTKAPCAPTTLKSHFRAAVARPTTGTKAPCAPFSLTSHFRTAVACLPAGMKALSAPTLLKSLRSTARGRPPPLQRTLGSAVGLPPKARVADEESNAARTAGEPSTSGNPAPPRQGSRRIGGVRERWRACLAQSPPP
jgi:hypothetical protein